MAARSYQLDLGKLLVLLASIVSVTVLALAGVLDSAATQTLIALAVGYTAGNGALARKGRTPARLLGPTPDHPERPAQLAAQVAEMMAPTVAQAVAQPLADAAIQWADGRKDGGVDGSPESRARAAHPSSSSAGRPRHGSVKRSAARGDA